MTNDDDRTRLVVTIPKGSTVGVWFRNGLREMEVVNERGERLEFHQLGDEIRTVLVANTLFSLPPRERTESQREDPARNEVTIAQPGKPETWGPGPVFDAGDETKHGETDD